jgi:hypothetical protein
VIDFNPFSNRSFKAADCFFGSPKYSSFVATNEEILRAMKKLGTLQRNCWGIRFCVFPKKT